MAIKIDSPTIINPTSTGQVRSSSRVYIPKADGIGLATFTSALQDKLVLTIELEVGTFSAPVASHGSGLTIILHPNALLTTEPGMILTNVTIDAGHQYLFPQGVDASILALWKVAPKNRVSIMWASYGIAGVHNLDIGIAEALGFNKHIMYIPNLGSQLVNASIYFQMDQTNSIYAGFHGEGLAESNPANEVVLHILASSLIQISSLKDITINGIGGDAPLTVGDNNLELINVRCNSGVGIFNTGTTRSSINISNVIVRNGNLTLDASGSGFILTGGNIQVNNGGMSIIGAAGQVTLDNCYVAASLTISTLDTSYTLNHIKTNNMNFNGNGNTIFLTNGEIQNVNSSIWSNKGVILSSHQIGSNNSSSFNPNILTYFTIIQEGKWMNGPQDGVNAKHINTSIINSNDINNQLNNAGATAGYGKIVVGLDGNSGMPTLFFNYNGGWFKILPITQALNAPISVSI